MTRFALPGLILTLALALSPADAEAWSGKRLSTPFPGPPLGDLQQEAYGRFLLQQYFRNTAPRQPVHPHHPKFVWIEPSWQWNGFQWLWVPGYWVSWQ